MRIVYVVHDFFPRFYGGTERYVLNIAQQMRRMGHSVTVLNYGLEDPVDSFDSDGTDILRKSYVYDGVRVISVRHRSIPAEIGFIIDDQNLEKVIEEILKNEAFDVMHIAHPMRVACCYKAAKRIGIPVVLTLTDYWLLCPRGRFYKPDYSLCNEPEKGAKCIRECGVNTTILKRYEDAKELFDIVDVLISPSRFLIEGYRSNGWVRDIIHINHGVDYRHVKPDSALKRNNGTISFGYTGVVTRFKGVDLLLKAFSEVNSSSIALKIYGNCLWETDFNQELETALQRDARIQMMGKYEHQDLQRVMSEIDIVVVPSSTLESYGLVVVESMAYGNPVIASDIVGSAYEYIRDGENGFIFPVDEPQVLKNLIEKISNDHSIVEKLRSKISLPPRIEEEAFMVESIYKRLFQ